MLFFTVMSLADPSKTDSFLITLYDGAVAGDFGSSLSRIKSAEDPWGTKAAGVFIEGAIMTTALMIAHIRTIPVNIHFVSIFYSPQFSRSMY
jgi:hypothetical protein